MSNILIGILSSMEAAKAYAVSYEGFSDTENVSYASDQGVYPDVPYSLIGLFTVDTAPSNANVIFGAQKNTNDLGYEIHVHGSHAPRVHVQNGSNQSIYFEVGMTKTEFDALVGDGKVHAMGLSGSFSSTGDWTMRAFFDEVPMTTEEVNGYSPPDSNSRTVLGARLLDGTSPFACGRILGVGQLDTEITDLSEWQAWIDAIKAANGIVAPSGAAITYQKWATDNGKGDPPSTWEELTLRGTDDILTTSVIEPVDWAW